MPGRHRQGVGGLPDLRLLLAPSRDRRSPRVEFRLLPRGLCAHSLGSEVRKDRKPETMCRLENQWPVRVLSLGHTLALSVPINTPVVIGVIFT